MVQYYPIDENLARRAKEMNSFYDYKEGSATASYREAVDEAVRIAEAQKEKVDPIHHERIDHLLDIYARKLAENINKRNGIAARVPSIMIAGGSNFPTRKKEKQNRAEDAAMEEWQKIHGLLDKIRSTGKGGISADDPEAVRKLKVKLAGLERDQEKMKAVNAYYRKHKTLDGCPQLSAEEIEKLKAGMARNWRANPKPYESFALTNNNANIRQTKARIEELSRAAETEYEGWAFDGGEVKMDRTANRLQVFFNEKPDRDTCSTMRHNGFKWAPSVGAWQRQLNDNALYAAKHMDCLRSLTVEQPVQESPQQSDTGWRFYIIADLKTWADNAADRSPLEQFPSFEEAKARFLELRGEPYNSEIVAPTPDGRPPARLTLGVESTDGLSAMDILHVRQDQNYLVDDFTRSESLGKSPTLLNILSQISKEIGFDRIRPHKCVDGRWQAMPDIPFEAWENPYFSSGTPGSVAARYCAFMRECYPASNEKGDQSEMFAAILRFLQREGNHGADRMTLFVSTMLSVTEGISETTQKRADDLMKELAVFKDRQGPQKEKTKSSRRKSQER